MTKKILVIDDDPVIRVLLTDCLDSLNYSVTACDSGIKGLEQLSIEAPDLVLLDMQMPVMDGIEVLRNIRASQKYSQLPVIMLSANSEASDILLQAGLKVISVIAKPFEVQKVLETIQATLAG